MPSTSPDIFGPLPAIERSLGAAVAGVAATPRLREAVAYATLGAGKRIRPLLAWHCCEALGGRGEDAMPACVAVELVHCFSLVHDDLPALDNDDLRRGKPTVHVKFGEAMAVLAGDAMLNMATLALAGPWERGEGRSPGVRASLLQTLGGATACMIAGQVADTEHDFDPALTGAQQRLEFVHRNKTGALLVAACRMGAACAGLGGGVPRGDAGRTIWPFADTLGLLFQAVDDLLDVTQSAEHTGKRTQKDADAGKLTFPSVYGVERTREMIREYEAQAVGSVQALGEPAAPLVALAHLVATRTR
ncbi:MAG: polyprenyl synthetase family protein [Phycisphaerales bacterium]